MQKIQPEIDELRKKKYEKDPQRQAQEMMGLWKNTKSIPEQRSTSSIAVSGSYCALLRRTKWIFALQCISRLSPSFLSGFTFSDINYNFLWLHLNDPDPLYILPVIIGALQFFQMFLMKRRTKNKKQKAEK